MAMAKIQRPELAELIYNFSKCKMREERKRGFFMDRLSAAANAATQCATIGAFHTLKSYK